MDVLMESVVKALPLGQNSSAYPSIMKPDIESSIKEGKPLIITIPVDDECKSPDVYVISDHSPTIKKDVKPERSRPPPRTECAEDVYVVPDNNSPIKQEIKTEPDPLAHGKTSPQESLSPKATIIVNIDDDDEDEEEDEDDEGEDEEEDEEEDVDVDVEDEDEDEGSENHPMTHKGNDRPKDWIIQDVIAPIETKAAQNPSGPVNVWFVKSVKVNGQNPPKGENINPPGAVTVKKEPEPEVNVVVNSSVPPQASHNTSGYPGKPAHHNGQASAGSRFGAPDAIDDEMEEKIQVCSVCSMCFTSLSALELHMSNHKEGSSWICAACGKSYYTKSSLDRHTLTHMREKPLKCPECGKGFAKQNNFDMHLRLHAGEVLFPCSECEKLFTSKASCDRHVRAHKMVRPHVCPLCGKGFLYNGCLIRHIRVHTGERPFPCPECGRCFRQTSALNRHVKTHSGEKPFGCADCGKCFTHQSDLNRHKETHRREQQLVQCRPSNDSSLATYIIL